MKKKFSWLVAVGNQHWLVSASWRSAIFITDRERESCHRINGCIERQQVKALLPKIRKGK